MPHAVSRREWVKAALSVSALLPALMLTGKESQAAELTPLDPSDPAAKAMSFVTDASKVDKAANSTFKPGQQCATCVQFQGKSGDATGGCTIFAGHSVPASGWCKVWTQRSG